MNFFPSRLSLYSEAAGFDASVNCELLRIPGYGSPARLEFETARELSAGIMVIRSCPTVLFAVFCDHEVAS